MDDEPTLKLSAHDTTKDATPLQKSPYAPVSSSSQQYDRVTIQKMATPFIDENATIKRSQTSFKQTNSIEVPVQVHVVPIDAYLDKPPKQKRTRRKRVLQDILIVFLLFMGVAGSVLAYGYHYYDTHIHAPLKSFIRPVHRSVDEPALNITPSYSVIMGRSWNILLMGSDNDRKYTFPNVLTQVMMVVHVDTVTGSVSMVSIPRDSWVNVPEVGGMHKIDQAFFLGASQKNSFDDGVREARLTVEKDYGITIDRYGWVGLSGFARVIDTLGGVDVDVTHPIVDDNYPDDTGDGANPNDPYAFKRLYIGPGFQHLNGLQALEYVRSRHADLIGDIGRTQRQQQVLAALKKKLTVDKLLVDLPQLIKDLSGTVYTDLNEQEMLAFANFGRTLPGSAIQRVTLGPGTDNQDYGNLASIYDPSIGTNQDVLIPHCENIQPVMNHIFGLGNAQSCNVGG
ncbi:MAG: hypothetical protein NVS4B11_21150 [Ktedonobacteraceae bacterium]